MPINFFEEDIKFSLPNKIITKSWIKSACFEEGNQVGNINIVFVSDRYLLEINKKYLNKSYFTDIITFNYNTNNIISGDIFISIDTVRDNSITYGSDFLMEVRRMIIHGILHLMGYNDKSSNDKIIMTEKEDHYLEFIYSEFQ